MGVNVIDRRLHPSGKSLPNRQRFIRLAKAAIKDAVVRSIRERSLGDVKSGEVVNIPFKKIAEPRLRHASQGGDREHVLPGNKEFVKGDTLPKPKSGEGGGGSEGAPDGEGEVRATSRPAARAASAVTGPMHATSGGRASGRPALSCSARKPSTVDGDVKVTTWALASSAATAAGGGSAAALR